MKYYDSISVQTAEDNSGEEDIIIVAKVGDVTEPTFLSKEEAAALRDGLDAALGNEPIEARR